MKEYIGEIEGRGTPEVCGRKFEFIRDGYFFYLKELKYIGTEFEERTTFRVEVEENKHNTWYLEGKKAPTALEQVLDDAYREYLNKEEGETKKHYLF